MHFQLVEKNKQSKSSIWCGVWLAAVLGALLSLVDSIQYIYTVLPGVALVIAAGFLPKKWQKRAALITLALCTIWFVLRFKPICNGLGIVANKLFKLSEDAQNYYYVYFKVTGKSPIESLFFVSVLLGALCALLGNAVNMIMTLLIAVMIAYFCVAPNIVWLSILLIVAFSNALPKKGRWLPAILVTVIVAVTAISIQTVASVPNEQIKAAIENFWGLIIPQTPPQAQKPPPIVNPQIPETPETPNPPEAQKPPESQEPPDSLSPPEEQETPEEPPEIIGTSPVPQMPRPDEPGMGKIETGINWQLITRIASAILLLSIVMAVWLAYAAKKRKQNRAAMYSKNNAEAIRGMFDYAKRWRKLNVFPSSVRQEVEDLWLEAVYSDHEMTEAQRNTMLSFVRYSAADAYNTLGTWERLAVYLYHAL